MRSKKVDVVAGEYGGHWYVILLREEHVAMAYAQLIAWCEDVSMPQFGYDEAMELITKIDNLYDHKDF